MLEEVEVDLIGREDIKIILTIVLKNHSFGSLILNKTIVRMKFKEYVIIMTKFKDTK